MSSEKHTACPICSGALSRGLCPTCGYDEGADFLRSRTLAPVSEKAALDRRICSLRMRLKGTCLGAFSEKAASMDPDARFDQVVAERNRLEEQQNYTGQIPLLTEATGLPVEGSKKATIWNYLGLAYAHSGAKDRGMECYRSALIFDADNPASLNNIALIKSDLGEHEEARRLIKAALDAAVKRGWKLGVYYANYALITGKAGFLKEAEEYLAKAGEAGYSPDKITNIRSQLGINIKGNGKDTASDKTVPADPDARYDQVVAERRRLEEQQNYTGQIPLLTEATGLPVEGPKKAAIWNYLGLAYEHIGAKDRGMECYKTALSFDADNPASLNNIALLKSDLGEHEEARRYMKSALDAAVKRGWKLGLYYANYASVTGKAGFLKEAEEHLAKAEKAGYSSRKIAVIRSQLGL